MRNKIFIIINLFILLSIQVSFSSNLGNNNTYLYTDKSYDMFPIYNKDISRYAIRDCDKKRVDFTYVINGNKNKVGVNFKVGEFSSIKLGDKLISIRCLENAWKVIDYNYLNLSKYSQGYILGKFYHNSSDMFYCKSNDNFCNKNKYSSTLYLVDNNGVPIWYRSFPSNNNYVGYKINNNNLSLLYLQYDKLPPQSNKKPSGKVININMVSGKVEKIVTPYEIIDNKKIYPIIDFHGFHESEKYYYFLSYEDKIINSSPDFLSNISDANTEKEADYDLVTRKKLCLESDRYLERRAKLIRTDKNGLVNYSFSFPFNDKKALTINYREDEKIKCEIDVHHPNWISSDKDDKSIIFSLFNYFIGGVDVEKNIISWFLYNKNDKEIAQLGLDKDKRLNIINDPLNGPEGTHSGSLVDGLLYFYDNRRNNNEVGRGVIYKLNILDKEAKLFKSFIPYNKKCLPAIDSGGRVLCNTLRMGNISTGKYGDVIVNWGDRGVNHNVYTVYDREGRGLLDVTFGKNPFPVYKNEYYSAIEFNNKFISKILKTSNLALNYKFGNDFIKLDIN
jgi:hypothetical protein